MGSNSNNLVLYSFACILILYLYDFKLCTYYKMSKWELSRTYVVFIPFVNGWRKWYLQRVNHKPRPTLDNCQLVSPTVDTLHLYRSQFNRLIRGPTVSWLKRSMSTSIAIKIYWKILCAQHSFKHSMCHPQIGACHWHLQSARYELQKVLASTSPEKSSGWGSGVRHWKKNWQNWSSDG